MKKILKAIIPYKIFNWIRKMAYRKRNLIHHGRIPHMGVLLTTGCNLNCRHCADLIPYRPFFYYKKEDVIRDLDKVLSSVREIKEVLLIGGEVMLYQELDDIIDWCIMQPKIRKIIITTNGTIMPPENVWAVMKNPKVILRISGYGINVAANRQLILDEVNKRDIKCEDLDGMIWRNIGGNQKRYRSLKQLKDVFQSCTMRYCVGLTHDGNCFFCSRQLAAYYTSDYPNPAENEYFNVRCYTSQELKKKWKEFYAQKYISTCDYCDGITSESEVVGTALQVIPTKTYVALLKAVVSHVTGTSMEIYQINEILESVRDRLADVKEFLVLERKMNERQGGV